jgi:hypothetical protein
MTQAVPVTATLPEALSGVPQFVPVTTSLAVNLPAGSYAFNVMLGPAVSPVTVSVSGTLNIDWVK